MRTKKTVHVAAEVKRQSKQDEKTIRKIAKQASKKAERTQNPVYQARLREFKNKTKS